MTETTAETTVPTGSAAISPTTTEQATSGATEPAPAGNRPPPEQQTPADAKPAPTEKEASQAGAEQNKNRGLLLKTAGDNAPADQQVDQKAGEKTGETVETAEAEKAGYDLIFPGGFEPDSELVQELKTLAGAQKLPQAEAQKLADLGVKLVEKIERSHAKAWETTICDWVTALPNHPVFGGAEFDKNMNIAQLPFNDARMREKFGFALVPPELKQLMEDRSEGNPWGMGLCNNPAFIHHFYNIGRLLADDAPVLGSGSGGQGAISEREFFAKMFH